MTVCITAYTGVLCGQCREGYGVGALTNNCRRYTGDFPEYYVLIPLYGTYDYSNELPEVFIVTTTRRMFRSL